MWQAVHALCMSDTINVVTQPKHVGLLTGNNILTVSVMESIFGCCISNIVPSLPHRILVSLVRAVSGCSWYAFHLNMSPSTLNC